MSVNISPCDVRVSTHLYFNISPCDVRVNTHFYFQRLRHLWSANLKTDLSVDTVCWQQILILKFLLFFSFLRFAVTIVICETVRGLFGFWLGMGGDGGGGGGGGGEARGVGGVGGGGGQGRTLEDKNWKTVRNWSY